MPYQDKFIKSICFKCDCKNKKYCDNHCLIGWNKKNKNKSTDICICTIGCLKKMMNYFYLDQATDKKSIFIK
jgi:hypothetical protein